MVISKKQISTVLIEGTIVGLFLIVFIQITKVCLSYDATTIPRLNDSILYFVAGFMFHISSEYTGLNLWYANNYCKL